MQYFHTLYIHTNYANKIFYINTNNFMQRNPKKEIGQLFENGHL
jgi:hypothetical protein